MAKVGAQRAAVLTGKSKSTIQRAMNAGKLSFELDQNQRRVIDVSELERVFGIQKQSLQDNAAPEKKPTVAVVESALEQERMKMKIEMLEEQLSTAQELIDDLKDQRNKWERQASQVLLTSQYSQKQAEELRKQMKDREERLRQRRAAQAQKDTPQETIALSDKSARPAPQQAKKNTSSRNIEELNEKMKQLKAQNENNNSSVFSFWKRAKE